MEAGTGINFISDREQSSALRTTLRLIPGAGVTPAEGSVKPTAGFTKDQMIYRPEFRKDSVFYQRNDASPGMIVR